MRHTTELTAADLFTGVFGDAPTGVWSAPGRVNLIGEHTDYNAGLVLPFAIEARTSVAASANDSGLLRIVSTQRPDELVTVPLQQLAPETEMAHWAKYVAGTVWSLGRNNVELSGMSVAISSSVPTGAGLSSSAALECAVAAAVAGLAAVDLPNHELAALAQRAENEFVGVPCGLMDQMASATSRAGHLLFFDVESQATQHIPFDPESVGLTVRVIDTRAHHSLADGEYAKRRADCERAASLLGHPTLRPLNSPAANVDQAFARLADEADGDRLIRRVRHVVGENARVQQAVELLAAGRLAEIGQLLTASHMSLRDDFAVSAPELDVAVDAALTAGALGARMTGGGFGGSVIALVPIDHAEHLDQSVTESFAAQGFTAPIIRTMTPSDGVRRDR